MSTYALSHLSDPELVRALHTLVAQDRTTTASLLAHLAEVDERRLYAPAGYPSMFAYCVGELRLAEDAACKRIQAARTARRFPAIFPTLAEGHLHLSGAVMLGPYLTEANAADLLAAAADKSKAELELLLAERFPRTELLPLVEALPAAPAPGTVSAPGPIASGAGLSAPGRITPDAPRSKLTPIASERFALQVSIGKETHELLCYAQALLGHSVPSGDLAAVLHHVLKLAVPQLEKRKFGATDKPRPRRRLSENPRQAQDTREDHGQATDDRERGATEPSQAAAEREQARARARAESERAMQAAMAAQRAMAEAAERERAAGAARARAAEEVVPYLRALGIRAEAAREAAQARGSDPDMPLDQRVKAALTCFGKHPEGRAA